jgi:hypothetical protein
MSLRAMYGEIGTSRKASSLPLSWDLEEAEKSKGPLKKGVKNVVTVVVGAVSFLAHLVQDLCRCRPSSRGTCNSRAVGVPGSCPLAQRPKKEGPPRKLFDTAGRDGGGHAGPARAGPDVQVALRRTRTVPPVDAVDRGRWQVGPAEAQCIFANCTPWFVRNLDSLVPWPAKVRLLRCCFDQAWQMIMTILKILYVKCPQSFPFKKSFILFGTRVLSLYFYSQTLSMHFVYHLSPRNYDLLYFWKRKGHTQITVYIVPDHTTFVLSIVARIKQHGIYSMTTEHRFGWLGEFHNLSTNLSAHFDAYARNPYLFSHQHHIRIGSFHNQLQ